MGAFQVMGIVNVTPDSFSDGGRYLDPSAAVGHGLELADEGAVILDVGGESTRPGAAPVGVEQELERVVPVIAGLRSRGFPGVLSVDTSKLPVAEAALDAGATLINDVTALRAAPELASLAAEREAVVCLVHMVGTPRTMQVDPRYEDVVDEVKRFLLERAAFAQAEGVKPERIVLDPGIGFGKTVGHNLELLRRLDELVALGFPVLIGTSRKSFLGELTGRPIDQRVAATLATNVLAFARGATIFRVHDVAPLYDALTVAAATLAPPNLGTNAMADEEPEEFDPEEPEELEEIDDDDDEEEGHPEPEVTIEISGLSLYTHMGVSAAEREIGQRLLIDVRIDIGVCDATVTDRIEDTVDYGEVCEVVNLVAQQRSYRTLERFCAAVADRLVDRYEAHAVWVKAAKPEPPIALPVGEVSVEVWREA